MKKILMLIFISFSFVFGQGKQTKSLELLKYQLNQNANSQSIDKKEFQYNSKKKKRGLAILFSALLPGMGELYADSYSSGKYFTIADGVLWGTLVGVSTYADNQEDNYRAFAQTYGGVNLNGKDKAYFANIANYLNINDYNHAKELERNFNDVYYEETHYWRWADQSERKEYRSMWKSSETAKNSTRFIVGALILNRVASVINAIRLLNAYNNNLEKEISWNVSFNYSNKIGESDKITMDFITSF